MKRMLVSFTDAKMAQAHWQNILIHLLLKHLPENEVFKKQHDWLSNYLSEISTNRGATSKADLKYIEKNILHIEANLRSNTKPTYQSLQSGRNRRTFNQEEKCDDRCGICKRKGHSDKECKSPCWICHQVGHSNKDYP